MAHRKFALPALAGLLLATLALPAVSAVITTTLIIVLRRARLL